ncbi:MAG: chemotaxis protein CheW [Polyangiales bacterium]
MMTLSSRLVGVVVDEVTDVIDVAPDDVQPPPVDAGGFVQGLARVGDRLMIQVDMERVAALGDVAA